MGKRDAIYGAGAAAALRAAACVFRATDCIKRTPALPMAAFRL